MKKTRVLSLRIPLEDLQSCFDFCTLSKAPTTIASSAITRTLSMLLSDLRASKSLPEYTASAIEQSCRAYKSIENPTSMPSLELSSTSSFSTPRKVLNSSAGLAMPTLDKAEPESEASISCVTSNNLPQDEKIFTSPSSDQDDLEDEIIRQMKEIELLDELDLLDKILIG